METLALIDEAPVSIVTHRRSTAEDGAYAQWQERVAAALAGWPGFIDRMVTAPPDAHADWLVVDRFRNAQAARSWFDSSARSELCAEHPASPAADEDVQLISEQERKPADGATVIASSTVPQGDEAAFIEWQSRISQAESLFRGFRAHQLQPPVPRIQPKWVIMLTFDTDAHLSQWIDSPQRAKLLEEGSRFNLDLKLKRASFGFDFWSAAKDPEIPVFKNNLLVLLVLYPIVFLWGYFVSEPLIDAHGVPFWLSLFVGNLVSTQLLGWFVVPWIFRRFQWWLNPKPGWKIQVLGLVVLAVLYAASMALYAWLIFVRS
jgi:antibiotic biosynthesis monooxygenase (ABM) superfamily enzyme